jgi:hypothetical protein
VVNENNPSNVSASSKLALIELVASRPARVDISYLRARRARLYKFRGADSPKRKEWGRLQEGSTHQTIYMPVFKKLQILLPPTKEQQKVAEVGEAFDRRIASERNALTTLVQNRAALAQELLSGRLRLPDSIIARHRDKAGQAA